MKQNEHKEIESEVQKLYKKIVDEANQGKLELPKDLKNSFLKLEQLMESEQVELINKLSKSDNLPKIMSDFIELIQFKQSPFIGEVPDEIVKKIATFDDDKTLSALALTSKESNRLFKTDRLFTKFLQQVAFGGQDKVEGLFTLLIKQKRDKEIQELLCKAGTVTDYSGRTFHCTAYEYAYWAKDTHMCRMLERNMDEDTKALMLKRCEAIEKDGLKYTQNGKKCCTSHFDLTPLKTALKDYVDGYDNWYNTDNWDKMKAAWMKVGLAQRDVPAHVIHEYCRSDRSFDPTPKFNEDKLPRGSLFYNYLTGKEQSLFPLLITGTSGIGLDFGLVRGARAWWGGWHNPGVAEAMVDLLAVSRLDEVRTVDLKQSLENLKPKDPQDILGHEIF